MRFPLLSFSVLSGLLVSALDLTRNDNLVLYWGQNSKGVVGSQADLATYCQKNDADVFIVAFLNVFFDPNDGYPGVNFAGSCNGPTFPGTNLLSCPTIGKDIQTCQSLGKTVLLSLGGASGAYGFTDDNEAQTFADEIWNMFGKGNSTMRPFGNSVVDGFDLDIEGGSNTGYAAFVNRMREHYASSSGTYYISGAPQCPIPDAWLGDAILNSNFDFVNVQFFNNYCGANTYVPNTATTFNFGDWDTLARTKAKNPNMKVFMGVPGSLTAAGTGYISPSTLGSAVSELQSNYSESFGGVMIWDASQAYANIGSDGRSYATDAKLALGSGDIPSSSSTVATSPVPTSALQSSTTVAPTGTTTVIASSSQPAASSVPNVSSVPRSSAQSSSSKVWWTSPTTPWWTPDPGMSTPVSTVLSSSIVVSSTTVSVSTTLWYTPSPSTGYPIVPVQPSSSSAAATSAVPSTPASPDCPVAGNPCTTGQMGCNGNAAALCDHGHWVLFQCGIGTTCKMTPNNGPYCDWPFNNPGNTCKVGTPVAKRDRLVPRAFDPSIKGPILLANSFIMPMPHVPFLYGRAAAVNKSAAKTTSSSPSLSATASTSSSRSTSTAAKAGIKASNLKVLPVTVLSASSQASIKQPSFKLTASKFNLDKVAGVSSSSVGSSSNHAGIWTAASFASRAGVSAFSNSSSNYLTSVSTQRINDTDFRGVLVAATTNLVPIGRSWSFTFTSNDPILSVERGNLTSTGKNSYVVQSIEQLEPSSNMVIRVDLWAQYSNATTSPPSNPSSPPFKNSTSGSDAQRNLSGSSAIPRSSTIAPSSTSAAASAPSSAAYTTITPLSNIKAVFRRLLG